MITPSHHWFRLMQTPLVHRNSSGGHGDWWAVRIINFEAAVDRTDFNSGSVSLVIIISLLSLPALEINKCELKGICNCSLNMLPFLLKTDILICEARSSTSLPLVDSSVNISSVSTIPRSVTDRSLADIIEYAAYRSRLFGLVWWLRCVFVGIGCSSKQSSSSEPSGQSSYSSQTHLLGIHVSVESHL